MDIQRMFERGISDDLFTDFDVCVRGPVNLNFSGGRHVSSGSRLFDVSSLTKALTYLVFWKLFVSGDLSPEEKFEHWMPDVPNVGDRELWHFMSYLVEDYSFDRDLLRKGLLGTSCKDTLLSKGFGRWQKTFHYDNYAGAFLGMILEWHFGANIQDVLHDNLLCDSHDGKNLLFHPVRRGLIHSDLVVPTRDDMAMRGLVHDPLSFAHPRENLAVAGVFSDAQTLAGVFHYHLDPIIRSGFYDIASRNQLSKVGIRGHKWALGFDIPNPESLDDISVESPLIFAGWTGCRIFFAKHPRVTIAITTNRVFCEDSPESRKRFSQLFWGVVREILRWS